MRGSIRIAQLALAATVAITFAGEPAYAQSGQGEYLPVSITEDSLYAYDRNSVRWAEGRPSVDLIWIAAVPRPVGDDLVQILRTRREFDCQARRYRDLHVAFMADPGRQVDRLDEATAWDDVPDDTLLSDGLMLVCWNAPPSEAYASVSGLTALRRAYFDVLQTLRDQAATDPR